MAIERAPPTSAPSVRRPVVADPDDLLEEALMVMVNRQVRRLPVVRHRRLVGVLALADIAMAANPTYVGEALRGKSLVPGRVRRSE
jgi:signal-transduction protein with cAMP-binding, CBS, and nucleotidyltransferase domain